MRRNHTGRPARARILGLLLLLSAAGAALSLSTGCAPAPTRPVAEVSGDHRPPRPHPHARWVEGHWTYQQGRYHWVRGEWAR